MNLETSKVKLDSSRVIGLKSEDMQKLSEAYSKKESSFTPNQEVKVEPFIQNQPLVEVVPEIMEGINNSQFQGETPEVRVEAPTYIQPLEEQKNEPDVFDIPVAEPIPMEESNMQTMQMPEEIQGGMTTELDTPQKFFDKVEISSNDPIITESANKNDNMNLYDDPALIMLDNLRDSIKSKNEMIKALNDKINVLENELSKANEARQVSEAQRVAAETTLAQAKNSQISGGPTLTYQQPMQYPNQNYNQAA